jgi:PKD repeat protein
MTVYYVNGNSGKDDNSGLSLSAAFATLGKAVAVATSPGDIVEVLEKTNGYYEELTIVANGTSANPITFRNYSGHAPYMTGNTIPGSNSGRPAAGPIAEYSPNNAPIYPGSGMKYSALLTILGSYITWDGIDIKKGMGRGILIYNYNTNTIAQYNTVKNCKIYSHRNSGVQFEANAKNCTLENCEVYDCGNFAPYRRGASSATFVNWPAIVSIKAAEYITIKDCTIHDNWGEAVIADANNGGAQHVIVQDCTFYDNFAAVGLHAVRNMTVERCFWYHSSTDDSRVYNADGTNPQPSSLYDPDTNPSGGYAKGPSLAIVITPAEDHWMGDIETEDIAIRNNIIAHGPLNAISVWGGPSGRANHNVLIANNTIYNCRSSTSGSIFCSDPLRTDIRFHNNIVFSDNGAALTGPSGTSNFNQQWTYSNNMWSSQPSHLYSVGTDVVSNTAPFQTGYNIRPAAGQGNPQLFRITSGSSAVNAGKKLDSSSSEEFDFADDYFKATRGANWDIGAHEYDNRAPAPAFITADFNASPLLGPTPLTTTFSDQSKSSGPINSWLWDFGDGSTPSTAQNPTHTYNEAGEYTVKLQVNGPAGEDIATKPNYITVTKTEAPPPPPAITTQRVAAGLQVLYHFDEGGGLLVADHSGAGTPLNLTLEDGGAARWLPEGGLELRSPARLKTDGAARKVIDACRQANAVTVEAWLKPANVTQSGPARILSISGGSTTRNVMLGQGLWGDQPTDLFDARLRTTERDANGAPSVSSPAGTAVPALTHVVYTRAQDGTATIYVNGAAVVTDKVPGDFSNWDAGFPLLLGNENGESRPWLGELHLAAIYARALNAGEIAQNYQAGHRPAKTATVTADFTIPAEQAQGVSPHAVAFDATASSASQGIAKYIWTFGDGGAAESANPTYTYTYKRHGLFDVTLEVIDREGASDRLTRAQFIEVKPAPTRVTDGLQALYTFLEGQGAVVRDVSQVGQALDLTIRDAAAVRWLPDGLAVEAPTAIVSAGAAGKIISACKASHALTVEAWLTPANATQQGPARIVSISKDPYERNVTLAQGLWAQQPPDVYDVRLRTTQTSANGTPSLTSPAGSLKAERTHVVYTRGANGQTRIYLNGKLAVETEIRGDFSSWDDGYRLRLVSEGAEEADRSWLGTLHLAAIYARDLSGDEVTQNYRAGLTEVEKEYTPTLLPDTPATFRRFLLQRSTDGSAGAENAAAPPAATGYGVQYPNLRCVLLWEGAEAFEIYDSLAALQSAYPRTEAALRWLDQ